jgi:hypothetical protein
MGKKNSLLFLVSLFLMFAIVAPFTAIPVKASQDSSGFPSITIESYTVGGVTTYYSGGSIPVGAVIDFRVWVDLYNIDPVKIAYGDGTADSVDFGGSFSYDFYHAYDQAGVYAPEAYMPTDSGTFTGFPSQPLTIGESGTSDYSGVPTVTGIGPLDALINGVVILLSSIGGAFGLSGSNATAAGVVVAVMVLAAFGIIMGRIRTNGTRIAKKPVYQSTAPYLGVQSTPQLLRSPEADKQEMKGNDLECKNLKAVWDDDKKKADFAKGLESAARARFARDVQHLPEEVLKKCKEYIIDQAKDRVQELTEDAITAFFVAVPEVGVLTHVFVEVSKYMTKDTEAEPGLFEKFVNDYNSVVNTHAEATRLSELADFRFNEYKTRCL